MQPLVSILIPAHNAQKWIRETLRSATGQTWERKEIIVVDDGSTDETVAIAGEFRSQGVLVVRQRNQGAAAARNRALALSTGDYIQWLDADDLLSPDKIALQLEAASTGGTGRTLLSSGWGRFLYRPKNAVFLPTSLWQNLPPVEWLLHKMAQNLHMQSATWLVSRELTETAGPWNTDMLSDDDGEYFCRVLLASSGVHFVRGAKVYYRAAGSGSLSFIGTSDRKLEAQWASMQLHIRYLRSLEESERVHIACLRYLQNWFSYFYPEREDLVAEQRRLAAELGGTLRAPSLPLQYAWIETLFGRKIAKRAQTSLPDMKWSVLRKGDWICQFVEDRWRTRSAQEV